MARRRNMTTEELTALAYQRAEAAYAAAVERGKARFARAEAREAAHTAPASQYAYACRNCGETCNAIDGRGYCVHCAENDEAAEVRHAGYMVRLARLAGTSEYAAANPRECD